MYVFEPEPFEPDEEYEVRLKALLSFVLAPLYTLHNASEYQRYLASARWKQKRLVVLQRAQYCCERCGERQRLEVHHLTYDRLGAEHPNDLMVLCRPCHSQCHPW